MSFWENQMQRVKEGKSPALTIEQQQEREKPELAMQENKPVEQAVKTDDGVGFGDVAKAAASGVVGWAESNAEIALTPESRKAVSATVPGMLLGLADYVPVIRDTLVNAKRQTQEQFAETKQGIKTSMSASARKALEAELINDNLEFTDDATKLSTWIMKGTETIARMVPDLVAGGLVGKELYQSSYDLAFQNGISKGLTETGAKIAAGKIANAAMMAPTAIASTMSSQGGAGVQVRQTIESMPWKDLAQSETFKKNFAQVNYDEEQDFNKRQELLAQGEIDEAEANKRLSNKDKLNLSRTMTAEAASKDIIDDPALLTVNALASFIGDATLGKMIAGKMSGGIASKVIKGAVAEGATEAPQGAMEQYAQNLTLIDVAGQDIAPSKGVAKSAAEGGLMGAVIGGGMGGGSGAVDSFTGRPSEGTPTETIPTEDVTAEADIVPTEEKPVAQRREELEQRLEQQREEARKEQVISGEGEAQQALAAGKVSPTAEELIQAAPSQPKETPMEYGLNRATIMQKEMDEFIQGRKAPTVAERRANLEKRLEQQRAEMDRQRVETGAGEVQARLSRPAEPTAEELILKAPEESGPTPGELEFRRQSERNYIEQIKDAKIPQGLKGKPNAVKMMNLGYRNALSDFGGLSERMAKPTGPSAEIDTMSDAIAKMGGLSRKVAEEEGFDPAMFKGSKTFSAKGKMTFDDAAESLNELGFTNRESKPLDSNDVVEMLYGEANNAEVHYSNLVNPEMMTGDAQLTRTWAKQLGGADKLNIAVQKALNNEPLGKRQADVIEDMLDTINIMRTEGAEQAKEKLQQTRIERADRRVNEFNTLINDAIGRKDHLQDAQAYADMLNEMPDTYTEEQVILDELVSTAGDIDFASTTEAIDQYEAGSMSLPTLLTKLSDITEKRVKTYAEAKPAIQKISEPTTRAVETVVAERAEPITTAPAAEPVAERTDAGTERAEPVTEQAEPEIEPAKEAVEPETSTEKEYNFDEISRIREGMGSLALQELGGSMAAKKARDIAGRIWAEMAGGKSYAEVAEKERSANAIGMKMFEDAAKKVTKQSTPEIAQTQQVEAVNHKGVSVSIPKISKEIEDGYNRSTHLGKGRDFNKEQKDTAISIINDLESSKYVIDTPEQKAKASSLISDYMKNVADFNRWNASAAINNPSWVVTGRAGRNMAKSNAKSERHMDEYVKRVDKLEKEKSEIKSKLYAMRPQEVKEKQSQSRSMIEASKNIGYVSDYLAEGQTALAADARKWAIPKAFKFIESAMETDKQGTIDLLNKLNEKLSDLGGLLKVVGERSKLGKLYSSFNEEPKAINQKPAKEKISINEAKEIGFDTSRILYHGTPSEIEEFDVSKTKDGIHLFSFKGEYVDFYATGSEGRVIPVYVKYDNPLVIDENSSDEYGISMPEEKENLVDSLDMTDGDLYARASEDGNDAIVLNSEDGEQLVVILKSENIIKVSDVLKPKSKSVAPPSKSNAQEEVPPILEMTKAKWVQGEVKKKGIKKGSPGYDDALAKINDSYENEVDKALASSTFETYQKFNSDTPESINRMAYDELRKELGTDEANKVSFDKSSIVTGTKKGMPLKEVDLVSKAFLKEYKGAAGAKVVVFKTQQEAMDYVGVPMDDDVTISGMHIPMSNEVVLIADNLDSPSDALKTLRHEILAHHGLLKVVGQNEWEAVTDLVSASRNASSLKDVWAEIDRNYEGTSESRKAEEVIAKIAEESPGKFGEWGNRIIAAVIRALRRVRLIRDKITDTEIKDMIRIIGERMKNLSVAEARIRNDINFNQAPKTTSEAFKRWFGDSKVVDENGDPLVVYHGSGVKFTAFNKAMMGKFTGAESAKKGFFFTDNMNLAESFSAESQKSEVDLKEINKLISNLSDEKFNEMYNKLRLDNYFGDLEYMDAEEFADTKKQATEYISESIENDASAYPDDRDNYDRVVKDFIGDAPFKSGEVKSVHLKIENPLVVEFNGEYKDNAISSAIEKAIKNGNDGVILRGMEDAAALTDKGSGYIKSDVYVIFEPNQVKSAIGNVGTYDPSNPDINFRRRANNDPWAAENKKLREEDKTLWQQGKNILKRNLTPEGLLPNEVFNEKIKRDSEFEAVEFTARVLVSDFDKAIMKAYKMSFDYLPQATKNKLSEALAGKVANDIAPEVKASIIAMRQSIDGLSGEYINNIMDKMANEMAVNGRVSAADEALLTRISDNIGAYVNRSYKAFDDPKWFKKVPVETVNAARDYFVQRYIDDGETESEAKRLSDIVVNEILKTGTAYDSMESFIAEGKLGAKDLSILMRKKVIDPEIRALLGEYDDPRINYVKSATKMGRLVWNERFLNRVLDIGMGSFLFKGKDRPANATKQIAGDQSETYSPLNGLWTFPEVEQAFKDSMGREQMSDLMRFIVRANGAVKYGKTVLSPTTAMRNFQSAMFFALANGHFNLSKIKDAMAAVRVQVTDKATAADIGYFVKLKRLGVVYDAPYAKEMARLLGDSEVENMLSSKFGDGAMKSFTKLNDFAQSFYSFGDDFWKIVGFENEKASLLDAGMSAREAEMEAAKRIRNTYPTYSMTGKAIKSLSRFPLAGTFVSFPAEIVRTSINMIKTVNSDIKSSNPKMRALGYKRIAGMAFVSSAFFALNAATKAMLGVTDDEEEAIRDLAAPWQKNSTFAYVGRDEKNNLQYFDMSFLDPYGYFKRPITAMLRDQSWQDAAVSGLSDLISPFLGADIVAQSIFEVLANKKGTGSQVYNENGMPGEQLEDISLHLGKTVAPGFIGNAVRIYKALDGQVSSSGKPYKFEEEMLSLVGWRLSTMDPKTSLHYKTFEFSDGLKNANRTIMKQIQDVNKVSDDDLMSAYESAKKQHDIAFKKMIRLTSSAKNSGMTKAAIFETLKRSGVSDDNAKMVIVGKTPPFKLSKASAENAIKKAKVSIGSEHATRVRERVVKVMKQ